MDVKGRIIQMLPTQTGAGKNGQWRKQEFIVETEGKYPKKVCLSAWGDKIDQFGLAVGQTVSASVELESREYNNRWYTEARAWKVDKSGGSNGGNNSAPPAYDTYDAPSSSQSSDDLPF